MGGIGSGQWYRWDTKTTCEQVKRVDIRFMRKNGLLQIGTVGTLSWTRGDEPSGHINYRVQEHCLTLIYRYRKNNDDWQDIKESVWLDQTSCHYGGKRLWFLCPHCNKRVAVLYGAGKRFLCRDCHNLPYSSQMSGKLDRLIEQKHKLGYRIFEHYDGTGWKKKKGIHKKTFDRLYFKYHWLDMKIDEGISGRLGGLASIE